MPTKEQSALFERIRRETRAIELELARRWQLVAERREIAMRLLQAMDTANPLFHGLDSN